ncbi:MAG: fibronectin type III domain-containing protein, partial [Acidimicrobiales bacterium]|nr:fibronectin type III domain-containing protein [Acidimicrobiales bacterium]
MSSNRSHLVVAVAAVLAVVASLGIGATPAAGTGATEPTEATTSVFTPIAELSKVSVGYNHACGIDGTGILYCWGSNTEGELGTGDTTSHTTPVAVATAGTPLAGTTVDAVAAGSGFTCALTATEAIACWGENANGELGNGSTTPSLIPTAATLTGSPLSGANITSLTTQHKHICARTSAGGAACWGANSNGQLGDGTQVERHVPTTVTTTGTPFAGVGIKSISAGTFHTCGVANDGAAACWGSGSRGALGDGTTTRKLVPTSPTLTGTPLDGVKVALLSASRYSTCAATVDGDLVCWGAGDDGQLANGGTADSLVPTAATTTGTPLDGADVVDIDSGFDHHCARTSTGTAVCWGDGYVGYLGTGTTDDALVATPVDVTDTPLDGIVIKELAAGRSGACIASAAKQPYCWGTHSTTGSGSTVSAPTPIPVAISSQVPTETPTITSTSVDDNRVSLEWSSVPGIGGTVPVSVVIRVYIGNDLVRTWDWPLFTLDGSGFATLNLEWDTTYRFTVAAVNQGGEGPESPQSNTVVVGPEPAWETSYHPITPCRILDTRIAEGPLANREIRDVQVTDDGYDIADQGGNPDGCPIPEDADAVEASVTAVSPSDSGFFRAWPTDESMPNATF